MLRWTAQIAFRRSAQRRLILEEFFRFQVGSAAATSRSDAGGARIHVKVGRPDPPGDARRAAVSLDGRAAVRRSKDIGEDMQRPQPMNRLLQGDVGSGKTIVALMAALVAMENGLQVAFMAPTEILAEQHFFNDPPAAGARRGSGSRC